MIRFELNGNNIQAPEGLLDFNLTLDENGQVTIAQDTVIMYGNGNQLIRNWINDGKIVKEMPFNVWVEGFQVFRGFIDLQDSAKFYGDRSCEVKIKSYDSYTWIEEYGKSVSFGVLALDGFITNSDFVDVKYQVNFRPDLAVTATTALGIYSVTRSLIETIRFLSTISIESLPQLDPGGLAKSIAKIIVMIIALVAQIVATVALIRALIDALLPQSGRYKAMRIEQMFKSIASYFGLTFESSIFQGQNRNIIFIPSKNDKENVGYPSAKSVHYNVGDFITNMKELFNADLKVYNGVMKFERWNDFKTNSNVIIKNNFSNQERLLNSFSYNTNEAIGNYNIVYQTDTTDINTLDGDGLSFQESIEDVKGLAQINIPFSIGKRKVGIGEVEEGLLDINNLANRITSTFGNGQNVSLKSNRGALLVSNKEFNNDKIAILNGQGVRELPASFWWNNFHFINSYTVNQWREYDLTPMEMTIDEFRQIINSNIIVDDNGKEVRIENITFNPSTNKAEVQYKVKEIYARGLNKTLI